MTLPNIRASLPPSKNSTHMDSTILASLSVQLKKPTRTRPSVMTTLKGLPSQRRKLRLPGERFSSFMSLAFVMTLFSRSFCEEVLEI